MLSWDDFRYVKAIADARSLALAAGALGVNHSTVFRRLGQIEQQLGSRLFDRSRGGYGLTSCGEQMVRLAARMSDEIVRFERRATGRDLRPAGELRVTTSELVLQHLLLEPLVRFRRAYPEIVLELLVANQMISLAKREADIAVRTIYQSPPEGLIGEKIADLGWAVFGTAAKGSQGFELARAGKEEDWVALLDQASVARMAQWYRQNVDESRIVYRANTMVGLAEAASAGMGLALLPSYVAYAFPQLTQLAPLLPELTGKLWVLTHPDLYGSARVRAFFDFCSTELGQQPAAEHSRRSA
ncbi:MAG: LysR family transcriptional regulator [Hyphomicrobiales bacterium]|nr:LysR family transcriptional regulator [Hyphomicrobiales bacterium]